MVADLGKQSLCVLQSSSNNSNNSDSRCSDRTNHDSTGGGRGSRDYRHRTAEELSMARPKHSPDLHPFLVLCNVYLQFLGNEKVESNYLLLEDGLILWSVSVKTTGGNDTVSGLRLSLKKLASFHSISLKPDQLPCENCQLEHKSPHWTEVSCQKWTSLRWARQPNSWSQAHEWNQLDQYKHQLKLTHIAHLHSHGLNKQMLF